MGRPPGRVAGAMVAALAAAVFLGSCASTDTEPGPATAPADPSGPCTVVTGATSDFPGSDGNQRTVQAWVPDGADASTPVVVAVHPALSTGERYEELTGLSKLAAADGAIVVYPSKAADPGVWDVSAASADVAFVADLIDYLHAHGCGEPANTTVLGYSSGAMLTSRLACLRPEGFSTAMMVGGILPPTWGCQVPPDLAIVALHATADGVVRYDGTVLPFVAEITNQPGFNLTRAEMVRMWSLAKGCPGPPGELDDAPVLITRYECPAIAPTTLVTYVGGGHDWRLSSNWDTSSFLWAQRAGA